MSKINLLGFSAILASLFLSMPSYAQEATPAHDWTTWGYDQQRTNWNRGETTLNKTNVSNLKLLWSAQLSTKPADVVLSTLTAPLVVDNVSIGGGQKNLVFLLGADDTLFALDADSGKPVWQKTYTNTLTPVRTATWLCANTAQATPVVDKQRGIIFFTTSDGKLRGLNLSDGGERMTPTDMVAPFTRSWSLNLIDNVLYTTSARGCGDILDPNSAMAAAVTPVPPRPGRPAEAPPEPGNVSAMDIRDLAHPALTRFYTSGGRPAGPWGRGGVARTPSGVVTQTADGLYDLGSGIYGSTVLELAPKATRVIQSFTPTNWRYINSRDLDMGSGSLLVFPFQNHVLAASAGKEGVVYLLDTAALGGPDHMTPYYKSPQLGNDAAIGTQPGQGMWGAMATYETPDGKRFLYVPMWGPPSKLAPAFKYTQGDIPNGSIMAFQVSTDGGTTMLVPQWTSPNLIVPDGPVVANGVVYALQTGEQSLQARPLAPGAPRVPVDPASANAFRATPVGNLILYAFDAETGKQLYSSKKIVPGWTHFSEPVVALGKVFVETHDGHVYAFGLH
jgi:outer membrane protein assembly factor BamB